MGGFEWELRNPLDTNDFTPRPALANSAPSGWNGSRISFWDKAEGELGHLLQSASSELQSPTPGTPCRSERAGASDHGFSGSLGETSHTLAGLLPAWRWALVRCMAQSEGSVGPGLTLDAQPSLLSISRLQYICGTDSQEDSIFSGSMDVMRFIWDPCPGP